MHIRVPDAALQDFSALQEKKPPEAKTEPRKKKISCSPSLGRFKIFSRTPELGVNSLISKRKSLTISVAKKKRGVESIPCLGICTKYIQIRESSNHLYLGSMYYSV